MKKSYIKNRLDEEFTEARLKIPYDHRNVISELKENVITFLEIHNKL